MRFALVMMVGAFASPSFAQGYFFSVPRMEMEVFVRTNASVLVRYEIDFHNNRRGQPLDAVDMGLFHGGYDVTNLKASLDGVPLNQIGPSPYVESGVEVLLDSRAIAPGERGVFRFEAIVPEMVYQDTTRDDYASLRVTPTWFDGRFVSGTTHLKIAIHMLPGIDADALLYQTEPFTGKAVFQDRAVAYWEFPSASITGPHMVGVSFPKRGMQEVVRMTKWDVLFLWWRGSPLVRFLIGSLTIFLFGFLFFRFSGGTGWSLFLVILLGAIITFIASPMLHLASIPFWLISFVLLWYPARMSLKRSYVPPIVSIEDGEIKRGLTAPEVAVLLELPLGKAITLVLFGLIKKKIIRLMKEEPFTVAVEKEYEGSRASRLQQAAENGVVLKSYEHAFLTALSRAPELSVPDQDFTEAMEVLVSHTVERVSGFDLKATRLYYKSIVVRAWEEAESLGEVEVRGALVDKKLEWMLLDEGYQDRFDRWTDTGFSYHPAWIFGAGTVHSTRFGQTVAPATAQASRGALAPTFGDVANSFAGWSENVASQAASAILPGTLGDKAGAVDLSALDNGMAGFFAALTEGGHGGSGGGGCAGCACACACAGGGR